MHYSYQISLIFIENKRELNQLCDAIDRGETTLDEIRSGTDHSDATVSTTTETTMEDCLVVPSSKRAKITVKAKVKPKAAQKV